MGVNGISWIYLVNEVLTRFVSGTVAAPCPTSAGPANGPAASAARRCAGRFGDDCGTAVFFIISFFVLFMYPLRMESGTRWPVSRVLYPRRRGQWPFIWGARYRTPRATDPDGGAETRLPAWRRRAVPTWSCSRWGLPCRPRRRGRGALLPHPFTLAGRILARTGGLLSVALSLGSPPPGVTRHRVSVEPGLSSPGPSSEGGHPAIWPRSQDSARPAPVNPASASRRCAPCQQGVLPL